MRAITGRKIWENGVFVGNCTTVFAFPCGRLTGSTPRLAWLVRTGGCCGVPDGYQLSMTDPYPGDAEAHALHGVITGVWLEFDGYGVLVDAASVTDVVEKCNACCDDTDVAMDGVYDGTFPSPADVEPTTFTVVREDNGGVLDLQRAMLQYLGKYVEGTFNRTSYNSGTGESTYTFSAYDDVQAIGEDTITETARVFNSNVLAAPSAGNHYVANATVNGVALPELSTTGLDTIANVITAIGGNATWLAAGTWTAVGVNQIRLTSGTAVTASIVLTIIPD